MRQPAKHASRPRPKRSKRGALIVEAALAAVIIGVALTYITRGLGGQLRALTVTGEQETLLMLARNVLVELEAQRMAGGRPSRLRQGTFEPPHETYEWSLTAVPQKAFLDFEASRILVVARQESGPSVELSSVWPTAWVPQEWF